MGSDFDKQEAKNNKMRENWVAVDAGPGAADLKAIPRSELDTLNLTPEPGSYGNVDINGETFNLRIYS